jgi:hypothetical protein
MSLIVRNNSRFSTMSDRVGSIYKILEDISSDDSVWMHCYMKGRNYQGPRSHVAERFTVLKVRRVCQR